MATQIFLGLSLSFILPRIIEAELKHVRESCCVLPVNEAALPVACVGLVTLCIFCCRSNIFCLVCASGLESRCLEKRVAFVQAEFRHEAGFRVARSSLPPKDVCKLERSRLVAASRSLEPGYPSPRYSPNRV